MTYLSGQTLYIALVFLFSWLWTSKYGLGINSQTNSEKNTTDNNYQKQSFADVLQNRCSSKISQISQALRFANLLKKRLQHGCFPVKFVKFLRTLFLQNTSGGCFWTMSTRHNITIFWENHCIIMSIFTFSILRLPLMTIISFWYIYC